jgi:hypothetical protein
MTRDDLGLRFMSGLSTLKGNVVWGAFAPLATFTKHDDSDRQQVAIKKLDTEEQLVFGEVYAPGFPDSQGDFMTRDAIKKMAYEFMRKSAMGNIDTQHNQSPNGSYVVESFIARDDDPMFIPGSWVMGVKCADAEWQLVKCGELNGFSLDGMATRTPVILELDIPDVVKGETTISDNHSHTFFVKFDKDGAFLGGHTSPARDGHIHQIKAGTCTEMASGHNHRFSFIETVRDVRLAG